MKFFSSNPHFEYLKRRWTTKNRQLAEDLFEKHFKRAALGSLSGLMLLTTPIVNYSALDNQPTPDAKLIAGTSKNLELASKLKDVVPIEDRPLLPEEDTKITKLINETFNIQSLSEISGIKLNRTYGLIGGEQHLPRYPGDTVHAHARDASDWAMYGGSGITPGLGAWGYFAPSKDALTIEDEQKERYYIAVQTFLAPGFSENVGKYRDFFKHRKMIVINPKTGQAVVAVIADAGPAAWTGKHLGGSPEVMHEVGLASGPRKGAVLYYFLDDPDNKVPLGPLKDNNLVALNK